MCFLTFFTLKKDTKEKTRKLKDMKETSEKLSSSSKTYYELAKQLKDKTI